MRLGASEVHTEPRGATLIFWWGRVRVWVPPALRTLLETSDGIARGYPLGNRMATAHHGPQIMSSIRPAHDLLTVAGVCG